MAVITGDGIFRKIPLNHVSMHTSNNAIHSCVYILMTTMKTVVDLGTFQQIVIRGRHHDSIVV